MVFGELCYSTVNVGDNIQTEAAIRLLHPLKTDATINRDSHVRTKEEQRVIFNGWFDGRFSAFPPPPGIDPLFISFHINEETVPREYFTYMSKRESFTPIATHVEYLRAHAPIGCRDLHTCEVLTKHGVDNYFSGCLTMTFAPNHDQRTNEILLVDVEDTSMIPDHILKRATRLSHVISNDISHQDKMLKANHFLERYRTAELVISTRLHVVLPCLAMKTKAVLLLLDTHDVRLPGIKPFLRILEPGQKWNIDIYAPKFYPNEAEFGHLVHNMKKRVHNWVYIDVFPKQISDGLSIVTACMGREEHAEKALPTWLSLHPDEIIIVAWGGFTERLRKLVQHIPRVRVIEVPNVKRWVLTRAFNLGIKFSRFNRLLKLDCDTLLDPWFVSYHNLQTGVFFAGNWKQAKDVNAMHLNGLFYANRQDVIQSGLFSEFVLDYGGDDDDLFNRLSNLGLKRLDFNLMKLEHIPHSKRLENQPDVKKNEFQSTQDNLGLCAKHPWSANFPMSSYACTLNTPNHVVCQWSWSLCYAETWTPFSSPTAQPLSLPSSSSSSSSGAAPYSSIGPPEREYVVEVETTMGLGNRLRTLASAYCVARTLKRKFILHWVPDHHCEARWEDLFEPLPNVQILDTPLVGGLDGWNESDDEGIDHKDVRVTSARVLKSKYTDWDSECRFLRHDLMMNAHMKQLLVEAMEQWDFANSISLHIRMGQDPKIFAFEDTSTYDLECQKELRRWRKLSHWSSFATKIKDILRTNPKQKFFVCADNDEAQSELKRQFGENVFTFGRKLFDRSVEQVQWALVEANLMAATLIMFIGSNWSTFTELVWRLLPPNTPNLLAGQHF